MKIAASVCATKSYTYAMHEQAVRVAACFSLVECEPIIILVGDVHVGEFAKVYDELMPKARIIAAPIENLSEGENYKEPAQIVIARMRDRAHSIARTQGVDYCWSLDSDVLPPANALRCMLDMLRFDNGHYSVSTCPYPNSAFLGGFGTPQNPIAEDFLPHERKLPDELKAEFEANEAELKALANDRKEPTEEQRKRWDATNKRIKECPPDGTIWEVIAKHGWRRRGWFDNAYPGIGRGSVVPSDWCGFGCTLMNRNALALAYFDGYDGRGTEDLFICWKRWYPAGLRINVIPHCPCDHVIWEKKKGGDKEKYTHIVAYHETDGEYRGHMRQRSTPFIQLRS